MKIRPQTARLLEQLTILLVIALLVLSGTRLRLVMLNSRWFFAGLAVLALVGILSSGLRRGRLLATPLDFGWLLFVTLTGLAVLVAPIPRRALEPWLLTIPILLPFGYTTVALIRRGWSVRLLYRAILALGFLLFALSIPSLLSYAADVVAAYQVGAEPRSFRLWGVLDHPAIVGMFLAITMPVMVGYLFSGTGRRERRLTIGWLALAAILSIAHGTRSAGLATLTGLIVVGGLIVLGHPSQPVMRLRAAWQTSRSRTVTRLVMAGLLGIVFTIGVFYLQSRAPNHAAPQSRLDIYKLALSAFGERPLSGWGSGGFIGIQMRALSFPPAVLVPHAHNLPLNLLAENGLIGFIGFVSLSLAGVVACLRAWVMLPEKRLLMAGLIGGVVGFLASGVLDQPLSQPGLACLGSVLIMAVAGQVPEPRQLSRLRRGLVVLFIGTTVLLTVGAAVMYSGQWTTFQKTVQLRYIGDEAVRDRIRAEADQRVLVDPFDPLARLTAAYAWRDGDLVTAIERFERAAALDPDSAVHWVNLSALYAKNGQTEESIQSALIATRKAQQSPVAWLNLGLSFERANHRRSAEDAYLNALRFAPHWARAAFWIEPDHPARIAALEDYRGWASAQKPTFYTAMQAGHFDEALKLAERAEEYLVARGYLAFAAREFPKAAEYFRQVLLMENGGLNWVYAEQGRWLTGGGESFSYLARSGVSGINGLGQRDDLTYSQYQFWRAGVVNDWIEGVVNLDTLIDPRTVVAIR